MICKKGNKLNRLIWQELLLYGFESLWSLRELFGQEEGHMPDKWTLFQEQLTQEVCKEQTKEAGEKNGGNSREHRDRESQGIWNLGGGM